MPFSNKATSDHMKIQLIFDANICILQTLHTLFAGYRSVTIEPSSDIKALYLNLRQHK